MLIREWEISFLIWILLWQSGGELSEMQAKRLNFGDKLTKLCKIKLKRSKFLHQNYCRITKYHYLCNVFFMVLDLRLTKIGCRETINFFCA